MTTVAPSDAHLRAAARPIPCAAPEMKTTREEPSALMSREPVGVPGKPESERVDEGRRWTERGRMRRVLATRCLVRTGPS